MNRFWELWPYSQKRLCLTPEVWAFVLRPRPPVSRRTHFSKCLRRCTEMQGNGFHRSQIHWGSEKCATHPPAERTSPPPVELALGLVMTWVMAVQMRLQRGLWWTSSDIVCCLSVTPIRFWDTYHTPESLCSAPSNVGIG